MPVAKITADQFVVRLNTGINDRNDSYDTEMGPIPDVVVQPTAQVLEQQNDNILLVSELITLNSQAVFQDEDVDNFIYNEAMIRNTGGRSSGIETFQRSTPPTADITVQRGYPIATQPDEGTGETVVFSTTAAVTMYASLAATYYNLNTNKYELNVPIQCTVAGTIGEVGPNRINRPLRPLNGFDAVFNASKTSTVTDRETNDEALERYKIAIPGTQLPSKTGLKLFIKNNFSDAGSVLVVNADDALVTRSGINGNAVDIFISGSQTVPVVGENQSYISVGQLIVLNKQPVVDITRVYQGATTFVQGTDYELVLDTSGVFGSVRAVDGIKFKSTAVTLPSVGVITVDYEYDGLIENIQNEFTNPDYDVGGQDPLVRAGVEIAIAMTARLITLPGFSWTTVSNAVAQAIFSNVNAYGLSADVEQSDLQAIVRSISGVDNFIFTLLDKKGGTGNADIIINNNEYPRVALVDISIIT